MHVTAIKARHYLMATVAATALVAVSAGAQAGGFEVREQSAHFQGMSFAGAAAGGSSLSSMFWNPAAHNYVGAGLNFESNYSLILPSSKLTVETVGGAPAGCPPSDCTVEIGRDAVVPASYAAVRLSPSTVLGVAINSQYGLATQPDNKNWIGAPVNTGAKIFSTNLNPSISHEIMPGLAIGVGLQIQYFDLQRFQTTSPTLGGPLRTQLQGDNVDAGWTLGINYRPTPGTSIGLGWRSAISHSLDGEFQAAGAAAARVNVEADIDTPDKVTLSINQAVAANMRLAATVEWTDWSRAGVIPITVAGFGVPLRPDGINAAVIDLQWEDGWYFALGGEYDVNDKLTLRAGGAYEISPIRDDTARLMQLPDADRIWASLGASYKWNESTTIDLAYTHIFVEDAGFDRTNATGTAPRFVGDADSSVDIISIGLKSRWGGAPAAAPVK